MIHLIFFYEQVLELDDIFIVAI